MTVGGTTLSKIESCRRRQEPTGAAVSSDCQHLALHDPWEKRGKCAMVTGEKIGRQTVEGVLRIEGILLQHHFWCNSRARVCVLEHV
jgi:hypothetical protein